MESKRASVLYRSILRGRYLNTTANTALEPQYPQYQAPAVITMPAIISDPRDGRALDETSDAVDEGGWRFSQLAL